MNPDEILEAARRAIEAGESPDDVARWIEEGTGLSLVEMAERQAAETRLASGGGSAVTDFLHQAAEGALLGQADRLAGAVAASRPSSFARPDDPRFARSGAESAAAGAQARQSFQQRTDDLQLLDPSASRLAFGAGAAPFAVAGLGPAVSAIRGVAPAAGAAARAGGRTALNLFRNPLADEGECW